MTPVVSCEFDLFDPIVLFPNYSAFFMNSYGLVKEVTGVSILSLDARQQILGSDLKV